MLPKTLLVESQEPAHFMHPALVFRDGAETGIVQQVDAAVSDTGYIDLLA